MSRLTLLIGGDFAPTPSNMAEFVEGNIEALADKELISILQNADFRIFNLETPLCDEERPIEKCGPHLIAPTSAVAGIKGFSPDLLSLANNHILDQGEEGLRSTIESLRLKGIAFTGVGKSLKEASEPYILESDGLKIGVYACADHEYSLASESSWGANPFDPLFSLDHIAELKSRCNYVIVLYHGGCEEYPYPTPNIRRVCSRMAEKGADLVVAQHSHCIGCSENYGDSVCVYGQGNFIFDYSRSAARDTALLIRLTITEDGSDIDYIPMVRRGGGVAYAGERSSEILEGFKCRSGEILEQGFVEKRFRELAQERQYDYYKRFLGEISEKFWFRALNKLTRNWILRLFYSKKLKIHNCFTCEAHRELCEEITALK